jgi:hypothetical protein
MISFLVPALVRTHAHTHAHTHTRMHAHKGSGLCVGRGLVVGGMGTTFEMMQCKFSKVS